MEEIRLQKYLADCGIASRRKCEELILQGKVQVNGKPIIELGTKINPEKDVVEFENKIINNENKKYVYILLNKPIGYVTTAKDQFGRDTVLDLVKVKERIVPVGRLDMYTSGALILTNDGDFVNKVTHSSQEIKTAKTRLFPLLLTDENVKALESGVIIDDNYKTKPAIVKILKIDKEKKISRIQITIHEGKNRQIRKMCKAIDKNVLALHRAKIGELTVKNIPLGKWKFLNKNEIEKLIK